MISFKNEVLLYTGFFLQYKHFIVIYKAVHLRKIGALLLYRCGFLLVLIIQQNNQVCSCERMLHSGAEQLS